MQIAPLAALAVTEPHPDTFAEFWRLYPRKVGRRKAETAYRSALKRTTPATILAGLGRHLPAWESIDATFVPHPTTWLNRDGWDDDPPVARRPATKTEARAALVSHVRQLATEPTPTALDALFPPKGLTR